MSIKRTLLTGAATLTIAAGVFTVGTPSAGAATPECDPGCISISIFSRELGSYGQPNAAEAVLGGVAIVGQPVILAPASTSDPSQHFLPRAPGGGRVSDFYAADMVSAELNSHYGHLMAAQIEYAPFGNASGLCAGLAKTAFQGQGLTLQPCTVPGRTVWIADAAILPTPPPAGYFPIVSGSTRDFSRPFAMTYPRDQQASDRRLQQIKVRRLQFRSRTETVPDRQLWGAHFGVLP
jgi:hypothetical protein